MVYTDLYNIFIPICHLSLFLHLVKYFIAIDLLAIFMYLHVYIYIHVIYVVNLLLPTKGGEIV